MKRFIRADARAGGGGEGEHFGEKRSRREALLVSPVLFSRARDAEKKTRVSARAAGGGRRGSRVAGARTSAIAAEPPFWEASPGFATPASAWSAIYAWGSAARGGRAPVRPVGYVSIAALAPFSFFFPTPSARRTGGRTRGRGRRAPGSPRARRVSTAGSLGRASRAGPAASASGVGARGASRERLARGDGRRVGGFASPPILRARASEEPFLPAGPRRAPPPPPRPRRPRARVCSACALALARVRRAVRVARPLASARAGAQCARGRARCSHHASNALLPFPRRVVPFRSFTTTGARVRASAGAARGRKSYGAQSGTFAYRPRQRGSANPQISRRRFRLRSGPR